MYLEKTTNFTLNNLQWQQTMTKFIYLVKFLDYPCVSSNFKYVLDCQKYMCIQETTLYLLRLSNSYNKGSFNLFCCFLAAHYFFIIVMALSN